MATEDLTLRMRASGARSTSRDVDRVGRSTRGVGKDAKRASIFTAVFARSLTVLQTRIGMVIIAATILTAVLGGPLLVTLGLLTAAAVAAGGVLLPVFALGAGVMQRFADTAGIAGSAASELTDVLAALKNAWNIAISPGAAVVMRGMSEALTFLVPLLQSLEPALTAFAHVVAAAMVMAAKALSGLGPELEMMLHAAAPLLMQMAAAVGPFVTALIHLAIAGMPVLSQMLAWLVDFAIWLPKAVDGAVRFAHTATAANAVGTFFGIVAAIALYLAGVISDLAGIAWQLWGALQPLAVLIGGVLLWGLGALADVIGFVNNNLWFLEPLILPIVSAFIAWKIAMTALTIATTIYTAVLRGLYVLAWANPITLVIVAIVALAAAVYLAYHRSETFRNIVNAVWNALKAAWGWVKDNWQLLATILVAPFSPFVAVLLAVIRHLNTIKSVASTVLGVGADIGNALLPGNPFGGDKPAQRQGKRAGGGPVTRSGYYDVGERGKERVWLPAGAGVEPHGGFGAREFLIDATFVLPDGTVMAKQTVRAARKKASTR